MRRPIKVSASKPFAPGEEVELVIDALTNLGAGVARAKGWVVFIPYTLPGEKVRAKITRNEKKYSHAVLLEVLEPAPERVEPRCALFGECGGCQYQHLDYASQLLWKTRHVAELMERMAGVSFAVNPCLGSPQQWHYRSKLTPHFNKPRKGRITAIGFLGHGEQKQIVDVPQCPIASASINRALPEIRQALQQRAGSIRKGNTLLLRACGEQVATTASERVHEQVGAIRFRFLAGDFFQNNPSILDSFTGYVAQQASAENIDYLVDTYCGCGLFALTLASQFKQVTGVDVSATSIESARNNATENSIENATFMSASAEAIFAEVEFPAARTTVIIDPPRTGCAAEFLAQLLRFSPARLVYVSCDPATQVRDLKQLAAAGYELVDVQPFDLFPQTRHLESVMTLVRKP